MSHSHAERRSEAHNFKSLRELMVYYADFLPMGKIEQSVRECALFFSVRRDASRDQERLQFISRCESAIKAELTMLQEAFARKSVTPPKAAQAPSDAKAARPSA